MVAMPYMRKRTLLGFGALAAGLAMVHKTTELTGLGPMRLSGSGSLSTPGIVLPHRLLYRYQSTLSTLFSSISASTSATGNMANLTPPQPAPKWTHTAQEILDITKKEIENHKAVEDKVAALSPSECNFESVCGSSEMFSNGSVLI